VATVNARQRRSDRKRWKYAVTVDDAKSFLNYDAMFDWCVTNFKNPPGGRHERWREKHGHFGTCWQFSNSGKAIAFALKWK
jgi:hypothetical protein